MDELVLSDYGLRLRKCSQRVQVYEDEELLKEEPAQNLQNILITSDGISFSTDAIRLLTENKVLISFLDFSGKPWAKVVSPDYLDQADIRYDQYQTRDEDRAIELMREFVRGKIQDQTYVVKSEFGKDHEFYSKLSGVANGLSELKAEDRETARDKLLGIESCAANWYWKAFSKSLPERFDFPGRVKQGAMDPVNSALNYGYGILYSKVWSILYRVHLDPYLGFLHTDQPKRPGLVMDFVEEFRQIVVDHPILLWLQDGGDIRQNDEGYFVKETRDELAELILSRFYEPQHHREKERSIINIMELEAREIVRHVQREDKHDAFTVSDP